MNARNRVLAWASVALEDPRGRRAAVGAAALAALAVVVRVLYPAPFPILLLGVVLGGLSALVGMGLVLVYRANRIVNFAQGDIGGLAAILAASLLVGPKWSFFPAFFAGLGAALLMGEVTERLVIRRFAKAPRLLLTVATIGLQQVFAAGQLALPRLFNYDTAPQPPSPFRFRFELFPVTFNAGHLLILIVVPLVGLGLFAFFRYTDVGIAVRASAESADRAALLGVPVRRVSTLVWVIAAGMSGLGVLLRLPIQGVSIGEVLGPSLMLRALAAAVIGRMESLTATTVAAMALGMVEQAVLFQTGRTLIADAVLFFVILAALLVQRQRLSRAEEAGVATWTASREVRPVPRELWALAPVRALVLAPAAVLGGFLVFVPLGMSSGSVNLLGVGLIYAIAVLSLLVLTGWAGQISLGQLAFVAFGASVAGAIAQGDGDFFVSLGVASLAGAAVAVVIGLPALRIRGLFLAVTTLAFALSTGTYFLNREFFHWVPPAGSRVLRPVILRKFDLESEHAYYYVVLLAFVLAVASVRSLRRSRTGRALIAVRDNRRAAQSYALSPTRIRLVAFVLSGALAGFAGGLYVYHQHGVSNTVLATPNNLRIFSIAVIGGLGSIPGALLGAGYLTFLDFSPLTRTQIARLLSSGLGLLLVLLVLPNGLGGLLYDLRDAILRAIARRKGLVVPSLVADAAVAEGAVAAPPSPPRLAASRDSDGRVARGAEATAPLGRVEEDGALLRTSGLEVGYGRTQVLFGVDFHVREGEVVALLGTNGAGKSTLLQAVCGVLHPMRGTVHYGGRDITGWGPNDTAAAGIVLMPGGRAVFPTLTVEENLRVASWLYRKDPPYVREATDRVVGYFPVLRERWKQRAGDLSGGEQQMLALAQAFLARPRLLLVDELSLGLAPAVVERLLGIVRAIHEQGTTVVLVEQSVNLAVTLAERAVFLEKGEVRFAGPTAELLERPDVLRAVFLQGGGPRAEGDGGPRRGGARATRRRGSGRRRAPAAEGPVVLEAEELTAAFGGVLAVDGVGLAVREGQIVGIIGPNGAGKTTLFDVLSGYVPALRGRVWLGGRDVTAEPPEARAAAGLGRSFQDARIFPSLTVREAIAVALERHVPVRDPLAAAVLSPAVRWSERAVARRVEELIELMHLGAYADKFVGELSTGTRRVVDLACALAHEPRVLLLDEPSSGLAQRESEALAPLLLELRDRTGAALVVVEHDIPLVTAVADELVAMEVGRVVTRGSPREVVEHPAVVAGYLGATEEAILRSGRRRRRAGAGRSRRA